MLHAFIRCETLLESICRNLLTAKLVEQVYGPETWGRPVWEQMPASPEDIPAIRNATESYLGRLVPLARSVQLQENCRTIILANGLEYPEFPEWREPSATILVRHHQNETATMPARTEKAAWRQLESILVGQSAQGFAGARGPLALQLLPAECTGFDLWTGGLIADRAKIKDTVEATHHITGDLTQARQRQAYGAGIDHAESASRGLHRAVFVYHRAIGDPLDGPDQLKRRQELRTKVELDYWTAIEARLDILVQTAAGAQLPASPDDWKASAWGKAVREAAARTYAAYCPSANGRQILAHVQGLGSLFGPRTAPAETQASNETTQGTADVNHG